MYKLILLLVFCTISISCAETPKEIAIFHTNDIHGHFTPEPAVWRKDHALVGGFNALSGYLNKYRAQYPRSLYLDAGDVMTGNPICNMEFNGVTGGALPVMLKRIGIDAGCLGNHEFDQGVPHLKDYITASPYPILCANLIDIETGRCAATPVRIFVQNGLRVGVVGLLLKDLIGHTSRKNTESIRVDDLVSVAQKYIDELDPKTDLIILLTHNGVDEDSVLACRVHNADVIVGGHSHTRLEQPLVVNKMIIVQAGSACNNLGLLDLTVAGDTVTSYNGKLIELLADSVKPMPEVAALADSFDILIEQEYGQTIGELKAPWLHKYYECSNVGSWICDRLAARYKTDVAFVNAGGIRTDLNAGPITKLDVLKILPFMNSVVIFEATGAELLKTAEEQALAQGLQKHGALEMSGLNVTYKKSKDHVQVVEAKINGKPVVPAQVYRVATVDYVTGSAPDKYLGFTAKVKENTDELLSEVIMDEVKKASRPIEDIKVQRLQEIQ